MKNASKFIKIFAIIALSLIVVGFVIFGVFGFNQDVNYKTAYQLEVSVEENISTINTADILKDTTDAYLAEKGASSAYEVKVVGEGRKYVYTYDASIADKIDLTELKTEIETAITEETSFVFEATVEFNQVTPNHFSQNYMFIIGAGVVLVALFLYFLFVHKLASAVAVVVSSVISALLYFAIVGGARIFAGDFFFAGLAITTMLTAVFTTAITEKCREANKNVGNNKLTYLEIADKATKGVSLYAAVASALALVAGVALAVTVSMSVGLQLIVLSVTSLFSAIAFGGFTWAVISKAVFANRKGVKVQEKPEENTEENA